MAPCVYIVCIYILLIQFSALKNPSGLIHRKRGYNMKKFLVSLLFLSVILTGVNVQAEGAGGKLLLYLPNRIIDMFDVFSLNVGFGPVARLELRATRACDFGGGIGASALLIKDYNRQYGAGLENGWNTAFAFLSAEDRERKPTTYYVKEYIYHESGIPLTTENIYNIYTGARDYWELGVNAALLVDFHFALHPIDIADFVTGWFFIDLKGDDITLEDLQN